MGLNSARPTPKELCYQIVFDDPGASIDTIARELSHRLRNHGLVKDDISRIRMEVRQKIDKAVLPPRVVLLKREVREERQEAAAAVPAPFNGIRFGPKNEPREKHPAPVAPETPKTTELPMRSENQDSSHAERRKFLDNWLLERVIAGEKFNINLAREALKGRFGGAIGTTELADAVKIAKEQGEAPSRSREPIVRDILKLMAEAGITAISRNAKDNTYSIEGAL